MKYRGYLIAFVLLIIFCIGLGYAMLSSNLNINGEAMIKGNTWDVHFENVKVEEGSVGASTVPTTDNATTTSLTYVVNLINPGDYYEFTVDAVNDGSIDAMVSTITKTNLNADQLKFLDYTATYVDGSEIKSKDLLGSYSYLTYKVRVEFKSDVSSEDLPEDNVELRLDFSVNYVQADNTSNEVIIDPNAPKEVLTTFATDSWDTIIDNVQNKGLTYEVGLTKEIDLGTTYGTHTVRVANNSTSEECSQEGFSQSACGFVLEFADIITTHSMNYPTDTNVGGWPATGMISFLNDTNDANSIINALANVIDTNKILDTFTVSGHGAKTGENNFTSTDKIYLLAAHEVWSDDFSRDTAYDKTRQLDYYANYENSDGSIGVRTSNYVGAIKKKGTTDSNWWLRGAYSNGTYSFLYVYTDGSWGNTTANATYGVAPAFRLA